MKRTSLFILSLCAIGGMCVSAQSDNTDNYGRLMGQIIDPETLQPVKEKFIIVTYYNSRLVWSIGAERGSEGSLGLYTDDKGSFSAKYYPAKYSVFIQPAKKGSKYCSQPMYLGVNVLNNKDAQLIEITKGKITRIKKKAILGGSVRIKLVDELDALLDFNKVFGSKSLLLSRLENETYSDLIRNKRILSNNTVLTGIYPGNYSFFIEFYGIGFNPFEKKNIQIESKKTTEIVIPTTPNDITGVEGYLYNADGKVIAEAQLIFHLVPRTLENYKKATKYSSTNESGYFKISAMPAGKYQVDVYFQKNNSHYRKEIKGTIDIKDKTLQKIEIHLEN